MIKNILVISSNFTGHGHKSITEALNEKFGDQTKVSVVDGFSMGGELLLKVGKMYGPITRKSEKLWEIIWNFSGKKAPLVNKLIQRNIEENFLRILEDVRPELILTVHPNFNGSIINILERHGINIPFVTLIADLISISPFWVDPRVDCVISPTDEAKEKCIQLGVSEDKVKVLGFPVRSRFYKEKMVSTMEKGKKELTCLIMSGGEGSGNMELVAKTLVSKFNFTVKIVAGRNEKLKKELEEALAEYGDKVQVYGFVTNIQDLMKEADIAFTRGSPNVMMEAVCCHTPLVITGALPGQEEENPLYAEKYGLAVTCHELKDLDKVIEDLLGNDCEKLNSIKESQIAFSDPAIPQNIVSFITNFNWDKEKFQSQHAYVKASSEIQVSIT